MAAKSPFSGKPFLTTGDFPRPALQSILDLARALKSGKKKIRRPGAQMGMVFFNPSLRTRVSFATAMRRLGGDAVDLNVGAGMWDLEWRRGALMDGTAAEHIREAARVLSRYCDVLGVRSFPKLQSWIDDAADPVVRGFAEHATVPVINMESCLWHPCQALADILTIQEKLGKGWPKARVLLTWAYHPKPLPTAVPNSFALIARQFGLDLRIACPEGFDLPDEIMGRLQKERGGTLEVVHDPDEAYDGVDAVYAKEWGAPAFYGNWEEEKKLRETLRHWRVTPERMARGRNPLFMHCLPVRRNVVVDDAVIDSPRSAVIDEAENRLHVQQALLAQVLG